MRKLDYIEIINLASDANEQGRYAQKNVFLIKSRVIRNCKSNRRTTKESYRLGHVPANSTLITMVLLL